MKIAIFISCMVLVGGCAYQQAKVVTEKPLQKPVYYAPVKGNLKEDERGFYIQTRCGEFFRSVEEGKVAYSGKDVNNYGWVIIVEQMDGYVAVYGKVGKPWVNQGEKVRARQVLGKVGKSKGNCGIHFELRDSSGKPVKPLLR